MGQLHMRKSFQILQQCMTNIPETNIQQKRNNTKQGLDFEQKQLKRANQLTNQPTNHYYKRKKMRNNDDVKQNLTAP